MKVQYCIYVYIQSNNLEIGKTRKKSCEVYLQRRDEEYRRFDNNYFTKSVSNCTTAQNDVYQKAILQSESPDSASNRLVARQANEIHSFSGRIAV